MVEIGGGYRERVGGAATADVETGVTGAFKGDGAAVVDFFEGGIEGVGLPWGEGVVGCDRGWGRCLF